MNRNDLERLSKDELIEMVLRLQRRDKTSRNSSKPPSTDRKERRENSKPGGAKPHDCDAIDLRFAGHPPYRQPVHT
jgi:transposase